MSRKLAEEDSALIHQLNAALVAHHAATSTDHDDRYYTETELDAGQLDSRYFTETEIKAILGIGSGNTRWINCYPSGTNVQTNMSTIITWRNATSTDCYWVFEIPLPYIQGTYNLYLTAIKVGIFDADAGDYLNDIVLFVWDAAHTISYPQEDPTNRSAQGVYTFTFGAATQIGGVYERAAIYLNLDVTDANDFDVEFVQVQYYYL